MAISKTLYQIEWSGSDSQSVSSSGNATSDARAIADNAISGTLLIKADNAGTPAAGDAITARILYEIGDPDADPDTADEYTTAEHAAPIEIDTNLEDPAIIRVPIDVTMNSFKLYVENGASSNSITVSAQYAEQTA